MAGFLEGLRAAFTRAPTALSRESVYSPKPAIGGATKDSVWAGRLLRQAPPPLNLDIVTAKVRVAAAAEELAKMPVTGAKWMEVAPGTRPELQAWLKLARSERPRDDPAFGQALLTGDRVQLRPPATQRTGVAGPELSKEDTLLRAAGLKLGVKDQYRAVNLKIAPQTLVTHTDAQLLEKPQRLGSGAFNTVYAVKYRGRDGRPLDAVFKPLQARGDGWASDLSGIDLDNPQTAMRNLATVDVGKALGFNVVPETHIGLMTLPTPRKGEKGPQLGLVMARAPGQSAWKGAALLRDPAVVREVTKLQLLDHLVGQGDRHSGNYFISRDGHGRVKVTGIDNDQCLGLRLTHPEHIQHTTHGFGKGFWGTKMPPVLDSEMADSIRSLTPGSLKAILGDKLTAAEVDAAVSRLGHMQRHVDSLEERRLIIQPDQWGSAEVQKLLTPENSYAARDRPAKW